MLAAKPTLLKPACTRDRPLAEQITSQQETSGPAVITADTKGAHAGEEVIAAATGPGAERVKGFFPNTWLFNVMMAAFGWKTD